MSIIKFNTTELLADSMLFSMKELGCYIRLATHYWVKGDLPSDNLSLARLAGCSLGEFKDVWPKVSSQFKETTNGQLICPSLDEEKKAAKRKSKKARASANARWGKATE